MERPLTGYDVFVNFVIHGNGKNGALESAVERLDQHSRRNLLGRCISQIRETYTNAVSWLSMQHVPLDGVRLIDDTFFINMTLDVDTSTEKLVPLTRFAGILQIATFGCKPSSAFSHNWGTNDSVRVNFIEYYKKQAMKAVRMMNSSKCTDVGDYLSELNTELSKPYGSD